MRQILPGRAVDQRIIIGQAAQDFARNRRREPLVVLALEPANGARRGGFQRLALAQNGIEQAQRGLPTFKAFRILGRFFGFFRQRPGPSGSSALPLRGADRPIRPPGPPTSITDAILSSSAIRSPVGGWVEKRVRARPNSAGTI